MKKTLRPLLRWHHVYTQKSTHTHTIWAQHNTVRRQCTAHSTMYILLLRSSCVLWGRNFFVSLVLTYTQFHDLSSKFDELNRWNQPRFIYCQQSLAVYFNFLTICTVFSFCFPGIGNHQSIFECHKTHKNIQFFSSSINTLTVCVFSPIHIFVVMTWFCSFARVHFPLARTHCYITNFCVLSYRWMKSFFFIIISYISIFRLVCKCVRACMYLTVAIYCLRIDHEWLVWPEPTFYNIGERFVETPQA